ncbi:MAG: hypothetical protein DCC59_02740 [Chloroflexi bacterium]|nr:hypothetical protein [Anaerolineales bacterium]RIK54802.1 MAG: hypothetical protein DCC59_02740 [Chloroflexota bacterium]
MEAGDIKFYVERWKAVEEIEREELRALTIERWRKINQGWGIGSALGLSFEQDESDMEAYRVWAKLKERHESSR